MTTTTANTLARAVQTALAQRRPGFELADGDIAVEHAITRRQVHLNLEPHVRDRTFVFRTEHGIGYYSLPSANGSYVPAPAASPAPTPTAPASTFDPAALQPKAYAELPPVTRWGHRRSVCLEILGRLDKPKLFVDGIPKAYFSTLKNLVTERSRSGVERYALRKPTPATVAIYRTADAPQPMPAAAAQASKATSNKHTSKAKR